MSEWFPNFPTNDEYVIQEKKFPGDLLRGYVRAIDTNISPINYLLRKDISAWKQILYNKILKVEVSYTTTLHYYRDGFSDENGDINLTGDDYIRKTMFDFFIDSCFYFIYSSFDTIGRYLIRNTN